MSWCLRVRKQDRSLEEMAGLSLDAGDAGPALRNDWQRHAKMRAPDGRVEGGAAWEGHDTPPVGSSGQRQRSLRPRTLGRPFPRSRCASAREALAASLRLPMRSPGGPSVRDLKGPISFRLCSCAAAGQSIEPGRAEFAPLAALRRAAGNALGRSVPRWAPA